MKLTSLGNHEVMSRWFCLFILKGIDKNTLKVKKIPKKAGITHTVPLRLMSAI